MDIYTRIPKSVEEKIFILFYLFSLFTLEYVIGFFMF